MSSVAHAGPKLNEKLLLKTNWYAEEPMHGISFDKGGKVDANEGDAMFLGTYTIKGVKLFIVLNNEEGYEGYPEKIKITCKLTSVRIHGTEIPRLKCDKFTSLRAEVPPPKEGTLSKIDNIKVFMMKPFQRGNATSNLKVRTKPSLKGKRMEYCTVDPSGSPRTCHKYLPKGTDFLVIARTMRKQKIGKWNNYWYRITYDSQYAGQVAIESDYKNGWVFAEFVKLK